MSWINRDRRNRIENLANANFGVVTVLRAIRDDAPEEHRKAISDAILIAETTSRGILRALHE